MNNIHSLTCTYILGIILIPFVYKILKFKSSKLSAFDYVIRSKYSIQFNRKDQIKAMQRNERVMYVSVKSASPVCGK